MLAFRLIALTALAALGLLISAATVPGTTGARQATPGPAPEAGAAQQTALVVSATNDPLRVAGSDGFDHLEYDLLVTNATAVPVTLTSIEVVAADADDETVLRLDGDALLQATQPLFSPEPAREIPASGMVGVVVDLVVPPDRALERLTHRIDYAFAADVPEQPLMDTFTIDGPELAVDPRRATVIAPPLRGDGWLALNGCCSPASGHRAARTAVDGDRLAKTEMFAIDVILVRDGRLFAGDGARREDWFGFGAEVLAVADGTVVAVRDGQPEETPNTPLQHVKHPDDAGGNFVIIEIAPGVYAFFAHFQPGSITVQTGDRVTTGQPLGLLGNSGRSTAPHLHFALVDAPDPFTGNSLPMVFDRYTLRGTISREAFQAAATGSPGTDLTVAGTPQEQTATLPIDFVVVDLP